MPYFDLCVFKNAPQVLSDAIIRAQVLLSEVDGLLVAKNGSGVRAEELLLYTHVVVGNRKHGCPVL